MNSWILLVTSLPTENATVRMRLWRSLKASGAATLRDGVYLLPELPACRAFFEATAKEVLAGDGSALVLASQEPEGANFRLLFDRSEAYAALMAEIRQIQEAFNPATAPEQLKQVRKLRKNFMALQELDFFPAEAQRQAEAALHDVELAAAQVLSPNEPRSLPGSVALLDPKEYSGRVWATRARPWVDRLASAWLIRRFIDHDASFLWLETPQACPPHALGFDFDGALFSHVGAKVTFEVLASSFGLHAKALKRMGELVHFLDVGGVEPAEAAGIESVLAGLRAAITQDDALLASASAIFDGLLMTFEQEQQ